MTEPNNPFENLTLSDGRISIQIDHISNMFGPELKEKLMSIAETCDGVSKELKALCGEENKGAPLLREETRGHQMMQGNTEPIEPLCIKKDGKLYANGAPIMSGEKSETNPQ